MIEILQKLYAFLQKLYAMVFRETLSHPTKKQTEVLVNSIHNESCLVTLQRMQRNYLHLVVTSPPYDNMRTYDGNNFVEFEAIASQLYRVMKNGGVVVWVVGDQTKNGNESGTSFRQALHFKKVGFNLFDTMIYLKPPRGACGNNQSYWQAFEYMFVFSKGKPRVINLLQDRRNKDCRDGDTGTKRLVNGDLWQHKRGGHSQYGRRLNVWEYNIGKGHSASDNIAYEHPAIFPERLAKDHILSWSNEGDIVYDPFMGSGTTAKMCIATDRTFIGSELNYKYCQIARSRLEAFNSEQM